ncbi:hypothetical protein CBS101457_004584 [Exobasidium rhododendri]|nr:hypothetical protein CBS101457_004584 [Exobasidium rhododendri]
MVFTVRGSPIGSTSLVVAVLASMGGFLFGYDTGQISGIQQMPDFINRFGTVHTTNADGTVTTAFDEWLIGLIVSLLSVGTAVGCLVGAPLADKLGRRKAMFYETIVFSIGVIIQVTSFHAWYQLAIGRIVTGLGVGALSSAVPLYQSETVPRQIRGAMVGTYQLFITFGILVAYCINIGTRSIDNPDHLQIGAQGVGNSAEWRIPVAMGIPFAIILGVGIMFCPESPRWLIANGKPDEAYRAVAIVRGAHKEDSNPWVEAEFAEIVTNFEQDSKLPKGTWQDCFKPQGKVLYRTLLGVYLQAGQQLTGANYFFYFGATIFTSVNLQDSFVTQIILGAVNFACTFLGLYVLERFGRRVPLIIGAAWMVVWLLVFGLAGTLGGTDGEVTDSGIGKLLIVSACMFILGYASTWAPGIWLFCGESFSRHTRAKQAAIATLSNWIWNFLIGLFSRAIADDIHFKYGFIFAGANFLNMIVAMFFVYETADLTLESIDEMYGDESTNAWKSSKWLPAGYASRGELKATENLPDIPDAKEGRWKANPDPITGEEQDTVRKAPETKVKAATFDEESK